MSIGEEIRIGILCNGLVFPRWQARSIQHLMGQPNIRVVALGVPDGVQAGPGESGWRGSLRTRILTLLCQGIDERVDLSEQLATLPVVRIQNDRLDTRALQELAGHGISAVLSFLPPWAATEKPTAPAIWHFDLGGTPLASDGMPHATGWMVEDEPVTLRLWSNDGAGVELPFSTLMANGRMDPQAMLMASAWLPVLMCRKHHTPHEPHQNAQPRADRATAGAWGLIRQWIDLELRPNREVRGRVARVGEWNLGIYPNPISSLLSEARNTNVRWLTSPSPGGQRSEPFGYRGADGQLNVLYRKSAVLGTSDSIARVRPRNDGILKRSRPMLETVHALGYPFTVSASNGVHVLINYPHQQRVELFRVAENNETLDHVSTLLDSALENPTCVEHEGRWWLFGTAVDEPDTVLRAYYADSFEGPYRPHAANPVRIAGSGCRSAGTFFTHEGVLWRPSVDNTDPHGPSVILNRIVALDLLRFQEEAVHVFQGFPGTSYPNGVRTICAVGDITLVDGLRPTQVGREVDIQERRTVRKAKAYTE